MIGNIVILIWSFVFIVAISLYIKRVWPDLDVLDLYIVFILFHFGFYPLVRGLYFGRDFINLDFRSINPLIISAVFLQVFLILTVIKLIFLYLPKTFVEYLKIKNLIQIWSSINKYTLLFIYGTLIVFQMFSYYRYGIKTYIMPDDFARIGKNLPYWFTAIRTVYTLLAFLVSLGLISSMLKSQGYHKFLWLILTLGFLPMVALYGRRYFLAVIMIWAILWLMEQVQDVFSMKYIVVGLLMILVFLMGSNLFQNYRKDFEAVGQVNLPKLKNPFAAAINFEATLKNLRGRPGTWEFNFLVLERQFSNPSMTTNGEISWEGIKSAIPRIFWPHKSFLWTDEILASLYHVEMKEIDVGKNLFGIMQVDFKFFSFIIVPLIILSLFLILGILIKITMQYPTFLWLFSGNILYFLINIEENGNEIFYMLRNVTFIGILFCSYLIANKIFKFFPQKMREKCLKA